MDSLSSALAYAKRGWHVFPCHNIADGACTCGNAACGSPGKHPRTPNGCKNASIDESTIRSWWTAWPTANVAVRTGPESGLFVVDLDGEAGIDAFAGLVRANGLLPHTAAVTTGGGGRHHYFAWPSDGGVSNASKRAGLPIDVRGTNGYVLAPPSNHISGNAYEWEKDTAAAPAPAWLLQWLRTNKGTGKTVKFKADPTVRERAIAYLQKCPPAYSKQGGHDQTFDIARAIVYGFDLGPDVGLEILLAHYNDRCQPPWSEHELRHKCQEADTKPYDKPRGWLLNESPNAKPSATASTTSAEPEPWEEPIPLGDEGTPAPFPLDCLPPVLADWASAQATALQIPVDLPALVAMCVCGAGLARKVEVAVRPGWREPLNLFAAIALPVGERKSALVREAVAPVLEVERDECERMKPIIATAKQKQRLLEAELKALTVRVVKEDNPEQRRKLEHDANQKAKELDEHLVPAEPRFYCDDATVEALERLLASQGCRMLQISPEGTPLEICKGRYSDAPNFDVYLKCHAGDSYRTDRIGREGLVLDKPALTLAVVCQPDVIRGLAEHAIMAARGYLARFLFALPASRVGSRLVGATPVPARVVAGYHRTVTQLWQFDVGKGQIVPLLFSPAADEALRDFERWIEPMLEPGKSLASLAGWANKLCGLAARIAGICHMAEGQRWDAPIGRDTVDACIRLAKDYLISHAERAFFAMGMDPCVEDAKKVLTWVNSVGSVVSVVGLYTCISRRDIHVKALFGGRSLKEVDKVIELLASHNYLRPVGDGQQKRERGRKPSPRYEVNPHFFMYSKVPHKPQKRQN